MIERALVIGPGRIGAQVGCEYALVGLDVTFFARDDERARAAVDAALDLASAASYASEMTRQARARIHFTSDLPSGASGRCIILEAVSEDLDLKGSLLGIAAEAEPRALIATSTSSLRVTEVGLAAGAPKRTVGIHYLNPPLLMPLVEIVPGEQTEPGYLETATQLVHLTGKTPILIERDQHGFAWNRLQLALIREAVALVEEGVISKDDVDLVVRQGLARRWRHVGPLTAVGLGGVDTWNEIGRNVSPRLSNVTDLPDLRSFVPPVEDPERLVRARDKGLIEDLREDESQS